MKDGRNIFNMKNEDSMRNLSQRLLIAFNESQYRLECQFICFKCLGISVNPVYCRHCKYSYCASCIPLIPASKIICLCRKSSKQNFEFEINQELLNTYYCIQDKSTLQKSQICYSDSLNLKNESPYVFMPSENADSTTFAVGEYTRGYWQANPKVSMHPANYMHLFSLKEARLINFNFAKGYTLRLEDKVLCANDGNLLRAIHLAKIELDSCYWNIDFSFSFNKAIISNKDKLKEIIVTVHHNRWMINLKSFLIICKALTFCSKLEIIDLANVAFQNNEDKEIPKSFYEFLSNSDFLKKIVFHAFVFDDDMNFKPFQSLLSLQSLELRDCTFNFNSFELMYLNNFPKLQILDLEWNKITNSFAGEKIVLTNPLLQKFFKPPCILLLYMDNGSSLENFLFETLIKSESIRLKSLEIFFNESWESKPIPTFLKFLNISNIQFLTLRGLCDTQGFDSYEFCEFLRNSKFLQGLHLQYSYPNFNAGLVLQALFLNKLIKVLYLSFIDLSTFISDLINLLLSNQVITILKLSRNWITIDADFINALSKNKSLLYLDSSDNTINNEDEIILSKLNLKGINVRYRGISKSNEEMIYKKIPKIEVPDHILECEKFLKAKKVD